MCCFLRDLFSRLFYFLSLYQCTLRLIYILQEHHTAKTKYRNFETNIPRKGISGSQSQFPHSCVCEWFIYSHDWSSYSAGGNMYADRSWDYINRSQTHECWNWGWGRAIPRKGIHKRGFSLQCIQGVTKRCRLSLLTNSALVYETKWGGGRGRGSQPMSAAVHWSPHKL
jgi:hypothetical protein